MLFGGRGAEPGDHFFFDCGQPLLQLFEVRVERLEVQRLPATLHFLRGRLCVALRVAGEECPDIVYREGGRRFFFRDRRAPRWPSLAPRRSPPARNRRGVHHVDSRLRRALAPFSNATSMPRSTASKGMPPFFQASIKAQSRGDSRKQTGAACALKVLLNFGEVVKIIRNFSSTTFPDHAADLRASGRRRRSSPVANRRAINAPWPPVAMAFVSGPSSAAMRSTRSIDHAQETVIQAGLNRANRVRADQFLRLTKIDHRQPRGLREQAARSTCRCLGRSRHPKTPRSSDTMSKLMVVPRSTTTHGPPYL